MSSTNSIKQTKCYHLLAKGSSSFIINMRRLTDSLGKYYESYTSDRKNSESKFNFKKVFCQFEGDFF